MHCESFRLIYHLIDPKSIFLCGFSTGLGDCLMLSALLPHLKIKYPDRKIIVEIARPELFKNNPYVTFTTTKHYKTTKRHIKPRYHVEPKTNKHMIEQLLEHICVNSKGAPELYLNKNEKINARNKYPFPYITICAQGKGGFTKNRKEWGVERFQELRDLFPDYKFIQSGSKNDYLLKNVIDARGMPVREFAAVIYNSLFFIGPEGGLMHLTKSINKRSVILYGGFLKPEISGYAENLNIVSSPECSPCFYSSGEYKSCSTMKCMKSITPKIVYEKIIENFQNELNLDLI